MINDIMPGAEEQLNKEMTSGYVGIDPTADSLHIGRLSASLVSSSCTSSQGFAADFLQTPRHHNALIFGYAPPAFRARSGLAPVRT